jgi:uncharacterized membrane protein
MLWAVALVASAAAGASASGATGLGLIGGWWAQWVIGFILNIVMVVILSAFMCACCGSATKRDPKNPAWGALKWCALVSGVVSLWPLIATMVYMGKYGKIVAVYLVPTLLFYIALCSLRILIGVKLLKVPDAAQNVAYATQVDGGGGGKHEMTRQDSKDYAVNQQGRAYAVNTAQKRPPLEGYA